MAQLLPDKEIRKLLSSIIVGDQGSNIKINPNGVELRLGNAVRFLATKEEKKIPKGHFLKINPGESVIVSSKEKIDFSSAALEAKYPGQMIMGFVTPTTTMMREGIVQAATKIDAGFKGHLNWGIRNGSTNPITLQEGGHLFKLTLLLLDENETPENPYGSQSDHIYQDTDGIKTSARSLPVDINDDLIVSSSIYKLDPKKRLQEAGYPFNYIGSELIKLDEKIQIISEKIDSLTQDIDERFKRIDEKFKRMDKTFLHIDLQFQRMNEQFLRIDEQFLNLDEKFLQHEAKLNASFENMIKDKLLWLIGSLCSIALIATGLIKWLFEKFDNATLHLVILTSIAFAILFTVYIITQRSSRA